MDLSFDLVEFVIKPGEHGHFFCSVVQFASRWWRFYVCMEKVEEATWEQKCIRWGKRRYSIVDMGSMFVAEDMPMLNTAISMNAIVVPVALEKLP